MTSISERLAKCFAEDGLKLSGNFGDVMRDEGVQWERDRTKPLVSALCSAVEALEQVQATFLHDQILKNNALVTLNAALDKMEGDRGDR